MTADERIERQLTKAKEALHAGQTRVDFLEAQKQERARKRLHQRHIAVGKLAQRAGLFAWDNATLERLFLVLARLGDAPNPEDLLESLLEEPVGLQSP